jgi:hypothetical protein
MPAMTSASSQQALENFAFEHRLKRSPIDLSKFMHRMFANRIVSWQEGIRQGTSIRQLVLARHREDGSGPTFEPLDDPGPTVTLSEPDTVLRLAAGASGARSSEKVEELAAEYDLPGVLDTLPGDEDEPRRRAGSSRWAILGAVLILCAALGVAVGLELRADSGGDPAVAVADPADAAVDLAPTGDPVDAAVPTAQPADAAPPPPVDAAPEPATLIVRGRPRAAVHIDGRRRGRTPARIAGLAPGRYTLELRRSGYESERRTVTLAAGETERLTVVLSRARRPDVGAAGPGTGSGTAATDTAPPVDSRPGSLRVASSPSCEVIVDGISRGYTALTVKLPPGPHRVRVVNGGAGIDTSLTVVVKPGEKHKVRCNAGKCSLL